MMIEDSVSTPRAVWMQRLALTGIIVTFLAAGWARLNQFDLLNPDSPRYLLYAHSIAAGEGYRMIDTPGEPLYTWRPAGLSLLLSFWAKTHPYDILGSKLIVLLTGGLLLTVVYFYTRQLAGARGGLFATLALATHPEFLVMSTEVVTEVPYTLLTLILLYHCARSPRCHPGVIEVARPWAHWAMIRTQLPNLWRDQLPLLDGRTRNTGGPPVTPAEVDGPAIAHPDLAADRPTCRPSAAAVCGLSLCLALVPVFRTVGVSLVAAMALWSLVSRRRWRYGVPVAVAVLVFAWWSLRGSAAGGPSYVRSLMNDFSQYGPLSVVLKACSTLAYYFQRLPGAMLAGADGLHNGYSTVLLGRIPDVFAIRLLARLVATACIAGGLLGLWRRRTQGGALAGLYGLLYFACVAIFPWRDERYMWPLVPILWAHLPAGVEPVAAALCRGGSRKLWTTAAALVMTCLFAFQALVSSRVVATNLACRTLGDAFYSEESPTFYFCDWRAAGRWLEANTPLETRILTSHAGTGCTAHRYQHRVMFEITPPEKLHSQIADFGARYLVVPDLQFGDGFNWALTSRDPVYRYEMVYRGRGVAILEISPNRAGIAVPDDSWRRENLEACRAAAGRLPERADLQLRLAALLSDSGDRAGAIARLEALATTGRGGVRLYSTLGFFMLQEGRNAEAAHWLTAAAGMPYSEAMREQLQAGIQTARQRASELEERNADDSEEKQANPSPTRKRVNSPRAPDGVPSAGGQSTEPRHPRDDVPPKQIAAKALQVTRLVETARRRLDVFDYPGAEERLSQALAAEPGNREATYLQGVLLQRLGRTSEAIGAFSRLAEEGHPQALKKLALLRGLVAFEENQSLTTDGATTVRIDDPRAWLELAARLRDDGIAGRALALLEQSRTRFPDSPEIVLALAELWCQFGRPDLACDLCKQVTAPQFRDAAGELLEKCRTLWTRPRY